MDWCLRSSLHPHLGPKRFQAPQTMPCPPPPPWADGAQPSAFCSCGSTCPGVFYEMGSRGVWPAGLVPLGITPSRPACGAAGGSAPPLPRPGSIGPGLHPLPHQPSTGTCVLPPGAAVSRASVNMCTQRLESQLALLRGIDPEVRLLGHVMVLSLTAGGPAKPF